MLIEIKYKDKTNWESVVGTVYDWTDYSKIYKPERVQPWYLSPEVVTHVWNGEEKDAQHTTWKVYYFQLHIREEEKDAIRQLKSSSDIEIVQHTESSTGTIITKTYNPDTTKSEYFQISEPEKISDTSGAKVEIIFRTERTVIDKGLPVVNTNSLTVGGSTFYSDYDVLLWEKPTQNVTIQWVDGTEKIAQRLTKTGSEYLQFVNSGFDYFQLIDKLRAANEIQINAATYTEIEYESQLIADNLWRVIIRGVLNTDINTFDLSPNNTHNITIDGTIYYTDWTPQLVSESPIINTVENQTGVNTTSKAITKKVFEVKFYMDETDAFNFKADYELPATTKTLDGMAILEEREVAPQLIGAYLYEITVRCLTATTSG